MEPESEPYNRGPAKVHTYLYPHAMDCLVVFVPIDHSPTSIVVRVLHDGHVQALAIVAVCLMIVRHIPLLRADRASDWSHVWLHMVGLCLAQVRISGLMRSRLEIVWTVAIVVFSIVASATLSAILYAKLLTDEMCPKIETLDELGRSGMTVYVAQTITDIGGWYSNLE